MKITVLLCIVVGHKWDAAAYPTLRCTRCDQTQDQSPGTHGPEGWAERGARGARADSLLDAREQPRPGERR